MTDPSVPISDANPLHQLASVIQDNATLKRMLRIVEPFLRREMVRLTEAASELQA